MAYKYIISALALASSAFAQCGTGSSFTIKTQTDMSQLQGCTTYRGDIIIDSSATSSIAISGLRSITGDLRANGSQGLTTITADQLQSIGGAFDLQDLQTLSTLQMDYLTSVGSFNFIGLPNLQNLLFTSGVSKADKVYISNTGLRDLKGIELTTTGDMNINNNKRLATVNVNSLTNVTGALTFAFNGDNLSIMLPNLLNAANMTFRAVGSVTIPSLKEVPGNVGFYDNSFQNVSAANLTRIAATLAIVGCEDMMDFSFPMLTLVRGGVVMANNTALKAIEGFPALSQIGGAIDFYGGFDAADLPSLSDVRGGATVVTTSSNSSICASFNNYYPKVIQGRVKCNTSVDEATARNSTTGGSGSGKSAASSVGTSFSMALTGLAALTATLLFL